MLSRREPELEMDLAKKVDGCAPLVDWLDTARDKLVPVLTPDMVLVTKEFIASTAAAAAVVAEDCCLVSVTSSWSV